MNSLNIYHRITVSSPLQKIDNQLIQLLHVVHLQHRGNLLCVMALGCFVFYYLLHTLLGTSLRALVQRSRTKVFYKSIRSSFSPVFYILLHQEATRVHNVQIMVVCTLDVASSLLRILTPRTEIDYRSDYCLIPCIPNFVCFSTDNREPEILQHSTKHYIFQSFLMFYLDHSASS